MANQWVEFYIKNHKLQGASVKKIWRAKTETFYFQGQAS